MSFRRHSERSQESLFSESLGKDRFLVASLLKMTGHDEGFNRLLGNIHAARAQ